MKNLVFGLVICGLLLLLWYVFYRPYEFEVKLKAHTVPGDVIETLRIWDRSLKNTEIMEVDSFYRLTQRVEKEGRSYVYDWHFNLVNDTSTQVNIEISQPGNSIRNKLLIPFTEQPIEKDAAEMGKDFYGILNEHLKITAVKVEGEAYIEENFCACTSLETQQADKAYGMMKDYGLLSSFVAETGLKAKGLPLVKVNAWNHSLGTLKYNFCFSIAKTDSLPKTDLITYKEINKTKALKAIYNGNYITSDRAWYALIHYAQTNDYEIIGQPIEFFHNNPNLGGNETEWKAEVYLPVK